MHGESFLHWSGEGTGEEKLSNSTQQSLYKDQLQGISLKKQGILRVYSVVTTRIGKSSDTPSEFQLQPNEESTQHAPRQVPTHTQEPPGNQCTVKPVKKVAECVNSFEIVDNEIPTDFKTAEHVKGIEILDEEAPADFNTGKHQFHTDEDHSAKKKMTGRLDSFLYGF